MLLLLLLELDGTLAEVVRVDEYVIVVATLVGECLRYNVLFRKIKGTHRPILVAFERCGWISIAVFHPIANIAFKQVEHFKELFADFVDVCFFILFVLLSDFFKAVVRAEFDLLSVVYSLFLAHGSVKIYMLLLERRHRARNLLHKNLRVGQRFVIFGEYLIFENA